MSHRLWQAWRGTLAQVLGVTPADGEPIWDNVTKRLRIGDGSTAGGLRVVMKADKDAADYGLAFEGVVTTATDVTHFKASGLLGLGTGFFIPTAGAPYEIFVVQADGAAPEGEQTPVVAYTSSDGTFQHAAFTQQLAVGDIVLILHPLIASLGTKATAAAAGAVTSTDYMMAYVKQLVSAMIVVDGIVDDILTDTSTTLQDAIDAIQADLGDTGDAIPAMTAAPGTLAALPLLKAILERLGVTPADPDDSLHTTVGQRDGAIPAMNAGISDASTLAMNVRAIMERLGATPADSDDPVHTALGQRDATATGDSLSDIASTDAHAKLSRLLLRFSADAFAATIGGSSRTDLEAMIQYLANYISASGGAYSVSLDGSNRTDIEALHAALATMFGTRNQAVSAGVLADTESIFALLRRLATSGSLVHFGDITAVSAGVSSTIADLIGWENDYFNGWWLYIVRDDGGAGAKPQGEYRMVTDYVSSSGLLNHTAFSTADAVGDQAMLIHPLLYGLFAATRGSGVESLESLDDELDAMPDMAEVRTIASPVTLTGSYQYIYTDAPGRPFFFAGGFMSRASGAWTTESVEIVVEAKFDGTNWRVVWSKTITAEPSPVGLGVPADANSALLNIPKGFWNNGDGVRVGIKQSIEDGGYHTWAHSFLDAVVGT